MPGANPDVVLVDYAKAVYGHPSPFPPSFDANPWAYAFGLFGDVVVCSMALAILLSFIFDKRRHKQAYKNLTGVIPRMPGSKFGTPLWLYRTGIMGFLIFTVMRTLPDVLWMLSWGEVELSTIELMLKTDMIADGFSIIPLFAASLCWAWGRQVVPQLLAEDIKSKVGGRPPWDVVRKNLKIVVGVIILSLLVAIGKTGV